MGSSVRRLSTQSLMTDYPDCLTRIESRPHDGYWQLRQVVLSIFDFSDLRKY
jgi:hypothetical protein